jgi:hypothetical protein
MKAKLTKEQAIAAIELAFNQQPHGVESFPVLHVQPIEQGGEVVGVNIPVINKSLIFSDIPAKGMKWDDAMAYAEKKGKALPTLKECYVIQFFRDEIAQYMPAFANLSLWSSSQYSADYAWFVYFNGITYDHI